MALTGKLTDKKVKNEKAPGRYGDGGNLYLQITKAGNKSWLFRYVGPDGREHGMGLGPVELVSLAKAREKAIEHRKQLLEHIDPITTRRARKADSALDAAKRMTFAEATEKWLRENAKRWKNPKDFGSIKYRLETYAYPVLGPMPIQKIDKGLLLEMLRRKDFYATKQKIATRVVWTIQKILSWAEVNDLRPTGSNPADLTVLKEGLGATNGNGSNGKHHPSLDYREIFPFMNELRTRESVAARALEFGILTAARAGEVLGARWDEIDLQARIWKVPGSRMKSKAEHDVMLSDRALEILQSLPREAGNDFIFIGMRKKGLGKDAMSKVIEGINAQRVARGLPQWVDRHQENKPITVHGFRASFKGHSLERMPHIPDFVSEMAMAHTVGSAVRNAYARSKLMEMRAQLLHAWAAYALSAPATASDNVVSIRAGAI